MSLTERLYYHDSGLLEFTATVSTVGEHDGRPRVCLDRTAFHPTGGGQPHDVGQLGEARVVDVVEDDGVIAHIVEDAGSLRSGDRVKCVVDRARRLDHMQQHSGQHILSRALVQTCGARTRSFHLGSAASTIDVELDPPNAATLIAAEDLANQIVFEDRPVKIHMVEEKDSGNAPPEKDGSIRGATRIVEVEGFDRSPCGGTHAGRTGQVGLIAIRSFERARKMTRIEFVCGVRALADYRRANLTAVSIARAYSAERDSTPELVGGTIEENKRLKRDLRVTLERLLDFESARLLESAVSLDRFRLVSTIPDTCDPTLMRSLAARLTRAGSVVALLGATDSNGARLVFARSPDVPLDVLPLMTECSSMLGGRGGGKSDLAQGGGPMSDLLERSMLTAIDRVRQLLV